MTFANHRKLLNLCTLCKFENIAQSTIRISDKYFFSKNALYWLQNYVPKKDVIFLHTGPSLCHDVNDDAVFHLRNCGDATVWQHSPRFEQCHRTPQQLSDHFPGFHDVVPMLDGIFFNYLTLKKLFLLKMFSNILTCNFFFRF